MKYLLPCKCGQSVEIEPSQAGQIAVCVCGEELLVPSMLQIKALPIAQEKFSSDQTKPGITRKTLPLLFFTIGIVCLVFSIFAVLGNWSAVSLNDPFFTFVVYAGFEYVFPVLAILFSSLGCATALDDETGILRKTFLILGVALVIPSLVFAVHLYKNAPKPQDVSLKQVYFSFGTNKRMLYQDSTPIAESEHQILWTRDEDIDQMMPMDLCFYFRTLEQPTFSYNYQDNYAAIKDTHRIGITANSVLFILALLSIVASFFMPKRNTVVTGWSGSDWR